VTAAADAVPAAALPVADESTLCVDAPPPDPVPEPEGALPDELFPVPVDALPVPVDALPVPVDALPEPLDALPEPLDALPEPVDALPEEVELGGKPSLASRVSCACAVARAVWSVTSCCSSVVTAS